MLKKIKKYNLLVMLLVLIIIFGIINPAFLQPSNLLNILTQNSIIGIVSLGMTIVIIIGGIDLSVGSIVAFCGLVLALLLTLNIPLIAALLITVVVGSFFGLINGVLIKKGKIPAFIVTLGLMSAIRGGGLLFSNSKSISIGGSELNSILNTKLFGVSFSALIFIVLSIGLWYLLKKTYWGKYIYAIGGNEKAARFNGIQVSKYSIIVYVISGLMCGIASILLVGSLNSAQPQAGQLYELTAIAAVVIGGASLAGGKGSIFGTFVGVLILGVIQNGLSILNVPSYYQYILVGFIIIVSVLIDKNYNTK
ncbi:ABC transporter permease [Winogradskyella luteola]|uniref:ABC transporter permease n=1 Tax=Winogradskyella luteola TaxID=2828330 RepID=A0A9X1JPG2_9FLAO|nr:ABC transporter permease [Winogradskyella luteola]MBV7270700.1 ABC transporter permease [Winogradskyella luteola]